MTFAVGPGHIKKVNDTQWIYTKMINLNKHKNILKKLCWYGMVDKQEKRLREYSGRQLEKNLIWW